MARNPDYQFVSTDTNPIISRLVAIWERMTGRTLPPASPDKLFILWVADVIIQERALLNYSANQNIPSRAEGINLDALGELFYAKERPKAKAAVCTMRFYISATQASSILIPAGTRATDSSATLFWATANDIYVAIGETYVDAQAVCQTPGVVGNGYAAGQINTLVDLFPYYERCENIAISDGGSDQATDTEYYQLIRASEDAYSTAGPMGGYEYWAKSVSTDIADVIAMMPKDPDTGELMGGQVSIYALMDDGTVASETIKDLIYAACNDAEVRPLTDFVSVDDPGIVDYNITFTYFIPTDTTLSAVDIQKAVESAVNNYIRWQNGKLGRDINPSRLISMLMETGVKRVELAEPPFEVLNDGTNNLAPEIARAVNINITNGGYENE